MPISVDLAVILAVDWLLDRCRTGVNLLSDGFGCVIVDHHLHQRHLAPAPGGGGKDVGGGGGKEGGGPGRQVPYYALGQPQGSGMQLELSEQP